MTQCDNSDKASNPVRQQWCYIFAMVNCTYISRNSSHVIQFHLKTSFQLVQSLTAICLQLLPCSYLQVLYVKLSMHWAIWMPCIFSKFLRITDKAYFLCISSHNNKHFVHSYENNTDTVTSRATLQINLSIVCSKINDNLQCRPQWVTNLVHLKY